MGLLNPPRDKDVLFTDITDNNASTTKHGFLLKLPGTTTTFLNGNGAFTTPAGGLSQEGSAYSIVGGSTSGVTNGTNLSAAYTAAKLATPQGSALAATNRFTIFLLPGVYDMGSGALAMDTSFIDLVGISTNVGGITQVDDNNRGDTVITSSGTSTITLTADDAIISNLFMIGGSSTFNPTTNKSQHRLINVGIQNPTAFSESTPSVTWAGYYENVRVMNSGAFKGAATGMFVRCSADSDAFGGSGLSDTASGVFIDCVCESGFGVVSATGTFIRCRTINRGGPTYGFATLFARNGSPSESSGFFYECSGGDGSFGSVVSGTYFGCSKGGAGRGAEGTALTLSGPVTGTIHDCNFEGWNGPYAMNTADSTAIANTAAETNFSLTKTIDKSAWKVSRAFKWEAWGKFSTDAVTPGTLEIKFKFGATVIRTTGAITLLGGATNAGWVASGIFTCRTIGGSGTISAQMKAELDATGLVGDVVVPSNGTVTVANNAAITAQLSATWSVADTDNTITMENFLLQPLDAN